MVSIGNSNGMGEIQEEEGPAAESNDSVNGQLPVINQTSQEHMLKGKQRRQRHLGRFNIFTGKSGFVKLNSSTLLPSPSLKFKQLAAEKNEISRTVPTPAHLISTKHFRIPFLKDISWNYILDLSKEWLRNPMNVALLIWIVCVAISGAILFMVMTGMLNHVLPRKSQRDTWFEVSNQILNALFTLMCLYQHPKRLHYLVLLCRWHPKDVLRLRKEYCKNGTYKPNEWMHMMIVVGFLNLNCFAQYALCGLNLGYPRSKRPAIGVGLCISVSFGAAAAASVYNILSPLGKEYETELDHEAQEQNYQQPSLRLKSFEKKYSFMLRDEKSSPENRPQWIGGIFDFWDDISLAYLSLCCSCCVFGWNMERLGFGNMYVHIVTFILFCMAPFFIFNLAAVNIDNVAVREALGITGIMLCVFGLLYGGFWRIQMRKRYNLPSYTFCCNNPEVTDCFLWLCCCSCSLAQEVRTTDFYDIVEDKFCLKPDENAGNILSPLPREENTPLFRSTPSSPYNGKAGSPYNGYLSTPTSPYKGKPTSPYIGNSSTSNSPYSGKHTSPYVGNSPSPNRYSVDGHWQLVGESASNNETMVPPMQSIIQKD